MEEEVKMWRRRSRYGGEGQRETLMLHLVIQLEVWIKSCLEIGMSKTSEIFIHLIGWEFDIT